MNARIPENNITRNGRTKLLILMVVAEFLLIFFVM